MKIKEIAEPKKRTPAAAPVKRVVFNQKGGVGKTTLSVNLSAFSAMNGLRTLLVDSDPQGNASSYLLGNTMDVKHSIVSYYESCLGLNLFRPSLSEFAQTQTGIPNLHLVTSHKELSELRTKLETKHKINKLKDGLKQSLYDRVYFDAPPSWDFFSISCLIAADEVIIPIDCDAFSLGAAKEMIQLTEEIRADHNPNLKIAGMVINQFQKNTKHATILVNEVQNWGIEVFSPYLPSSVKVRESHSLCRPVVVAFDGSPIAQAFGDLWRSIEDGTSRRLLPENKETRMSSRICLENELT